MREFSERKRFATPAGRTIPAERPLAALLWAALSLVMLATIFMPTRAASDEPTCGAEIGPDVDSPDGHSFLETVAHFTPAFVAPPDGDFPAIVAGKVSFPDEGAQSTVLFVGPRIGAPGQSGSDAANATDIRVGWRGYYVQEQASFTNAYMSPQTGQAVLFSMLSVEGPGHDYQVISTGDAFATVRCGTVPPPDTSLDTLDFMDIQSVQLDDKGYGELSGIVRFGDDRPPECFASTTGDGGVHWTVPSKVGQCIDNRLWEIAPEPERADAVSSLRQSVGL